MDTRITPLHSTFIHAVNMIELIRNDNDKIRITIFRFLSNESILPTLKNIPVFDFLEHLF